LAPEYAIRGQVTRKADIYSFGVLLLEVISGQSSSKSIWGPDMHVLLEWVTHFSLSPIKCETANLLAFAMLASTLDGLKYHTPNRLISTKFSLYRLTVHVDNGVHTLHITFSIYEFLFF
jgi:hypothetical protein